MTFKELRTQLEKLQSASSQQGFKMFEKINNKPFWIWEHEKNTNWNMEEQKESVALIMLLTCPLSDV